MPPHPQQTDEPPTSVLWGVALVWIVSSAATLGVIRLGLSGTGLRLGIPSWLGLLALMAGIWQWLWVVPVLVHAKRRGRRAFYSGMLTGAISFTLVNVAACALLVVKLRHFSLQ